MTRLIAASIAQPIEALSDTVTPGEISKARRESSSSTRRPARWAPSMLVSSKSSANSSPP